MNPTLAEAAEAAKALVVLVTVLAEAAEPVVVPHGQTVVTVEQLVLQVTAVTAMAVRVTLPVAVALAAAVAQFVGNALVLTVYPPTKLTQLVAADE